MLDKIETIISQKKGRGAMVLKTGKWAKSKYTKELLSEIKFLYFSVSRRNNRCFIQMSVNLRTIEDGIEKEY